MGLSEKRPMEHHDAAPADGQATAEGRERLEEGHAEEEARWITA
jgi:hypothetical protein